MSEMRCYMSIECHLCIDDKLLYEETVDTIAWYCKGWILDEECRLAGFINMHKDNTEWY